MRKPYATQTRAKAVSYLRECMENGRTHVVNEAVRRGIGANRASARRILRWAADRLEFDPVSATNP